MKRNNTCKVASKSETPREGTSKIQIQNGSQSHTNKMRKIQSKSKSNRVHKRKSNVTNNRESTNRSNRKNSSEIKIVHWNRTRNRSKSTSRSKRSSKR